MLLEQRVGCKVGSVTPGRQNDGTILGVLGVSPNPNRPCLLTHRLALILVLYTGHCLAVLDELVDFGLFENLDPVGRTFREILELE